MGPFFLFASNRPSSPSHSFVKAAEVRLNPLVKAAEVRLELQYGLPGPVRCQPLLRYPCPDWATLRQHVLTSRAID